MTKEVAGSFAPELDRLLNNLHRTLDMTFRAEASRMRTGYSSENVAVAQRIAPNRVTSDWLYTEECCETATTQLSRIDLRWLTSFHEHKSSYQKPLHPIRNNFLYTPRVIPDRNGTKNDVERFTGITIRILSDCCSTRIRRSLAHPLTPLTPLTW